MPCSVRGLNVVHPANLIRGRWKIVFFLSATQHSPPLPLISFAGCKQCGGQSCGGPNAKIRLLYKLPLPQVASPFNSYSFADYSYALLQGTIVLFFIGSNHSSWRTRGNLRSKAGPCCLAKEVRCYDSGSFRSQQTNRGACYVQGEVFVLACRSFWVCWMSCRYPFML